jgi:phosphoglycerate dehydrogenase-like enzyme
VSPGDHAAPIVLVTWPDYDAANPALGGALTSAGLELRLAPKLGARSPDELAALLAGVMGAIVSTDPFTADVLRAAVDLRVIARVGVGVDSIDLDAASERGIQVATTPGANEHAVADHAVGLMLALLRRVPLLDRDVRAGGWHRTGIHMPRQLTGATVGLVGYGHIGRRVAARLRGFDVELLIHDPVLPPGGPETSIALDELLRSSDVVSLHCPLIASTRHLIDGRALGLMRPDAVLVNTSRGGVVDEPALVAALRAGSIAGAALDVFEGEPPAGSPLLELDNVVVSPHNAGLSTSSVAEMTLRATQAVLDVAAGGVAIDLVNVLALDARSPVSVPAGKGAGATLAPDVTSLRAALTAARASAEVSVIAVPTDPDRSLLPSGSFWDLGVPMEAAEPEVEALAAAHVERAERQRPYV